MTKGIRSTMKHSDQLVGRWLLRTATVCLVLAIAGCASTSTAPQAAVRSPAKVEIEQAVGFTITEPGRVSTDARLDYNEAQQLLDQGDTSRAIAILEALADEVPHLSAPRIDLGIAYHKAGDLEKAELNLQRALEANPAQPVALNELGIVYRKTGRFNEAKKSYQAALGVYPNYHYARRNLGILCDLYLAEFSCALRNYEAYLASVPDDRETQIWIADLRQRMGQPE